MDVSIIIVSWNVKPYLQQCLRSIFRYTKDISFEVIVVDNASRDGSADMVATDFPQVKLIHNLKNRGFGAANNQGLAVATGQYIVFLNDDTEIQENIFLTLVKRFQNDHDATKKIGVLGCRLVNPDGSQQDSVRAFPKVFDQTIVLLKLHHLFPQVLNRYLQKQFDYTLEQKVEQVMGAFMFVPKSVLKIVGGFDEAFFNWFEEVDFQQRILRAGFTVQYTPVVSCVHVKGSSFGQLSKPISQRMFNRSMRIYFYKHHSRLAYWWISVLSPISVGLAYVAQIIR